MQLHAFWAVQHPATFQQLMQNCLEELNLIYCLIYLDDIVIFLHTAEEHLHHLHVVFDQFREHNLKLKSSKYNLFKEEITYLAHRVSKVRSATQLFKLEGHCQVCTASDLHRGACLPRFSWSLWEIYQGVHTYWTATQQSLKWGRSQQDI